MYSSEDLERFYFQYQTEAMPNGISIEQFCSRNKVPYNIFVTQVSDLCLGLTSPKAANIHNRWLSELCERSLQFRTNI